MSTLNICGALCDLVPFLNCTNGTKSRNTSYLINDHALLKTNGLVSMKKALIVVTLNINHINIESTRINYEFKFIDILSKSYIRLFISKSHFF